MRRISMEALTSVSVAASVPGGMIVTLRLRVVSVGIFTTKEPAMSKVWSAALVVKEREYSG